MSKTIVINIEKCLACKSCELACALAHSKSNVLEDAITESPKPQARVSVESSGKYGAPLQCRHCIDAACISICPTGAIRRESNTSPVMIDPDLCIGCKMCMLVCPFGVLRIGSQGRAVIKCDMCYQRTQEGKLPACVEACPIHGLEMISVETDEKSDRNREMEQHGTTTSRIQTAFTKSQSKSKANDKKIIVIGSSAAGMMAAISAARENPDAVITVVTQDSVPYRRPAIPAIIEGAITGPEDAEIFTDVLRDQYHIEIMTSTEVTGIDQKSKTIILRCGGKDDVLSYDAAIFAVGGHPLIPKISGAEKPGVCTFTSFEAAGEIVRRAQETDTAVVVGASFIALEIAEALMHKGLKVYFNIRSRILRKLLEPELSEFLEQKFEQRGLELLTEESISEIGGRQQVEYVLHKGRKIETSLVVIGAGMSPNSVLAEKCGINLGATGAIQVNHRMETSVEGIYAAGDCAESPDSDTGSFIYMPLGSIGASAGVIAGVNAAGGQKEISGFLRAQGDEILGYQIFSIGHSSTTAKEVDLPVNVYDLVAPESAADSGNETWFEKGKLLVDGQDRIVGAQLISQKHGSRFACQLYKAILESQTRDTFLQEFGLSYTATVKTLVQYEPSHVK